MSFVFWREELAAYNRRKDARVKGQRYTGVISTRYLCRVPELPMEEGEKSIILPRDAILRALARYLVVHVNYARR